MCLRSPEPASAAILLLQRGASSDAAVATGDDQLCSKFLSSVRENASRRDQQNKAADRAVPLPLWNVIDPLDDTRDARWISLISITMRHVFDSQNHKDT